jgi:hypothetical protein
LSPWLTKFDTFIRGVKLSDHDTLIKGIKRICHLTGKNLARIARCASSARKPDARHVEEDASPEGLDGFP